MCTGKVLLFGDLNVDNICTIPEIPKPGRDVYATHIETHLGGAVCNSAVVFEGLQQPSSLLGAIGDDQWGEFIIRELKRAQVDTHFIVRKVVEGTGLIFICVMENGERTMFSYRGANTIITPEDIPENVLDNVKLVHLSGYVFMLSPQRETAWRLIELAEERGIPIGLDTGLDPVVRQPDILRNSLSHLAVCITGEDEARILTRCEDLKDQATALLAQGIKLVAIKLGSRGAYLAWPNGEQQLPAFQVQVKDTTGAGDAFSSGLIYGYMHGYSPRASGTLANALGGLATTVYGAAWIGLDEVLPFLQSNLRESPEHLAMSGIQEVIQNLSMNT